MVQMAEVIIVTWVKHGRIFVWHNGVKGDVIVSKLGFQLRCKQRCGSNFVVKRSFGAMESDKLNVVLPTEFDEGMEVFADKQVLPLLLFATLLGGGKFLVVYA